MLMYSGSQAHHNIKIWNLGPYIVGLKSKSSFLGVYNSSTNTNNITSSHHLDKDSIEPCVLTCLYDTHACRYDSNKYDSRYGMLKAV